jgi:hypothetical protein
LIQKVKKSYLQVDCPDSNKKSLSDLGIKKKKTMQTLVWLSLSFLLWRCFLVCLSQTVWSLLCRIGLFVVAPVFNGYVSAFSQMPHPTSLFSLFVFGQRLFGSSLGSG